MSGTPFLLAAGLSGIVPAAALLPSSQTPYSAGMTLHANQIFTERPDEIGDAESFIRRFCILPDAAYFPLAVWIVATHLPDAFDAFPYIALLSPAKRCGKTRVLEVLEPLTSKAWRGTSASSATLFRMMEDTPTLLLDEVEALGNNKPSESAQAVLAVLNAGHRKGATIPRCVGPEHEVRHFPVYGPKAFAAIGTLPDTLADRCIHIAMQRKTPSQSVDRFLQGRARADAEPIRESLAEWAKTRWESVNAAYENMGDLRFLSDRDADLWMPLFAVCTVAAPERLVELQRCAVVLSGAKAAGDVEDSLPLKLLADVQKVWPTGADRMTTAILIQRLKEIAESPWAAHDLNANRLSAMLRPFEVAPRQIRTGSETVKGYLRASLDEAFSRYLPPSAFQTETIETTRVNIGDSEIFNPKQSVRVSVAKNASNPHEQRSVSIVSVQEPVYGGESTSEASSPDLVAGNGGYEEGDL